NREVINSDHRHRILLDRYVEASQHLADLYEDKDGLRKEEVAALSGPNELAEFYNRVPMSVEFEEINKQREANDENLVMVDFTDEEGYEKKTTQYREYLHVLLDYLYIYVERVKPLLDLGEELDCVNKDFTEQWDGGRFPGWPKETGGALAAMGAHLDLSAFSSSEELMSLGLDRLKSALMALGLKCGGTLEERAQRLFKTKGMSVEELDPSLFAKSKPGKVTKGRETEKIRELAMLEAQVYRLTETLSEQRMATKENVQRKQARRDGEEEEEEEASASESEDEADDEVPYNPKNLPLGWDGKPIPYWLYKLHGLNISYNCEICGNFTYKGPKAFQRHFAEWRHAHGMRCLGIPNTAHFANVTQIEDALKLWEKLKVQKTSERWQSEQEEEYEDSQGNVVNRKTFDDLKRQGLL
ncbi:Splicing factor 3A subunit 3-like, partial [Homarus americanus]